MALNGRIYESSWHAYPDSEYISMSILNMENTPKPALLFMPDISGFTQFVTSTEISHSQHIIAELLQTIIDSNELGLKIVEIEGDAIFFYKADRLPTAEELATQCRKTFIAFHKQLRKYDLLRICNCGACSTATQLTLKMVAHAGNVSILNINNQQKLFGSDVILIHRLLKNEIPEHEYMMLTAEIPVSDSLPGGKENEWVELQHGSSTYDVGTVNFRYAPLKPLYQQIPEPVQPQLKVYRVNHPQVFSAEVLAPMSFVYGKLMELKARTDILPGVAGVRIEDEPHNQINKLGTTHECIREKPQGLTFTARSEMSENRMMFTETSAENPFSFDYVVEKTGEEHCRISFGVHMKMNPAMRLMYNLTMKKKFSEAFNQSVLHVKETCEKLFAMEKAGSAAGAH